MRGVAVRDKLFFLRVIMVHRRDCGFGTRDIHEEARDIIAWVGCIPTYLRSTALAMVCTESLTGCPTLAMGCSKVLMACKKTIVDRTETFTGCTMVFVKGPAVMQRVFFIVQGTRGGRTRSRGGKRRAAVELRSVAHPLLEG